MKKHELGFEHFKKSNGTMSNADIAELVGAAESTVRKWKSRYKWDEKLGKGKSVTTSKKSNVTKNKKVTNDIRCNQREQVVNSLVEAGTYSPALDLLINIYLDCYEEYESAKQTGNETEKLRKELARLLGQLGLDGKNKDLIKRSGVLLAKGEAEKEKEPAPAESSKLVQFRQRMQR